LIPVPFAELCLRLGVSCPPALAASMVTSVSTDTRTLKPGDLYVALPGETFDARRFVAPALAAGASSAWCRPGPDVPAGAFVVQEPVRVLDALATMVRARLDARVIAVAGSAGKTTVKEMLKALLAPIGPVVASEKSFNNHIGVPKTLLSATASTRILVAEVGTNHPGELGPLTRRVRPHAVVMTSIGAEHLEGFGTIDGVLREEMEAVRALPPGGRVYIADDCVPLSRATFPSHVTVERVGFGAGATRRGTIEDGVGGVGVRLFDGTPLASSLAFGWQRANLLLAGTVARLEGVSSTALSAAASSLSPAPLRGEHRIVGSTVLLVDCYNSNPLSAGEALRDLATRTGRKAALLGDMRELGASSSAAHEELGALAKACGVNDVIFVGEWGEAFARGFGRSVPVFAKAADAANAFERLLAGGGTVLMKASRSIALESLLECAAHG